MRKHKHIWINSEKYPEKICVVCGIKASQLMAALTPTGDGSASIKTPLARETITINTGESNMVKIEVYQDDIEKELTMQVLPHMFRRATE